MCVCGGGGGEVWLHLKVKKGRSVVIGKTVSVVSSVVTRRLKFCP